MADVQLPQFEDYIKKVQGWMEDTAKANVDLTQNRDWCLLGLTDSPTEANLKTFFDRSVIGDSYKTEYEKDTDAGPPFAFLQMESDLIYSLHRCFTTRHRGRLMSYRDDCVQKNYRNFNALSLGAAKLAQSKADADKLVQWQSQAT